MTFAYKYCQYFAIFLVNKSGIDVIQGKKLLKMPQDGKKMIFDRIQLTENFFGECCSELSSLTKKKARFVLYCVLF